MAKAGQRKCMSCGEFFVPDHRSGERQRYCCAADCRRASKAASQAAWLARPPNNDYFSGPVHVARVQAWRAAHPGYARGRVRPSRALQDFLTPQVPDWWVLVALIPVVGWLWMLIENGLLPGDAGANRFGQTIE